jgi:multicomponent Na+:H+ antiporter subunit D
MLTDWIMVPAFPLVAGAFLLILLPGRLRSVAFLIFPLLSLTTMWLLPEGFRIPAVFVGQDIILCELDRLSRLFGTVFCIAAFIGGIYSFHLKKAGEQVSSLIYAGGALGVVFAGDYLTLFIFWELMAVSSTVLIWARGRTEAEGAGFRYLLVHLFGGGLLLWGVILQISRTGSLLILPLAPGAELSAWLILAGVGLNAAIPPLHAWLSDAYPKATVTGAVFLSAFTTKAAVYVLLRVFPGWEILVFLGTAMALYGVIYAVLANDIREILAYHIISQVGYMVAGAGIGTDMAINGAAAHAFCHILYKGLLFMGAGVVLHTTGRSKLTELGGLYAAMPATVWLYMIGAFSSPDFHCLTGSSVNQWWWPQPNTPIGTALFCCLCSRRWGHFCTQV